MWSKFRTPANGAWAKWSNSLLSLIPLIGLGLVLALIGWPLTLPVENVLVAVLRALSITYGALVLLRTATIEGPHWTRVRGFLFGPGLALFILITALFEAQIGQYVAERWSSLPVLTWLIALAALLQLLALLERFRDWLPSLENGFFSRISRVNPGLILVLTFGLLILAGTLLLKMPNATTGGLSWLDALFTSTSAVCVTGLIVVDTATAFTPLGQGIILLLIQLGAFGIVILTFFLAIISGQGFSVSSRVFLRDMLSVDNMRYLSATVATIIILTFCFEIAGAVALHHYWASDIAGGGEAWWIAVFHSISAFCNAGFSIFTDGLADPRAVGARDAQGIIMVLIVLGGIGFPVLLEVGKRIWHIFTGPPRKGHLPAFSMHCRLVFVLTFIFIFGGAALLVFGEGAGANASAGGSLWEALFNSITSRTAGFNISDMGALPSASTAVIILLMFIGGSPGGIAGGIKTTTFAMAVLNLRRILLNRKDVQMFERRVADELTNRAFAVVLLSILWIFSATTVLLYLQPEFALIDTLFEIVSAFSTVGLSRGITGELNAASKNVIILTMLVGRIGVLNFFFSIVASRHDDSRLRYPRERIIIE